jgi:ATP-dependent phosphofructokinase / diphosphate-dependent phosphofructokinase
MSAASSVRRIGILTSGGDCPGLNAVIRGVCQAASLRGYEVLGFSRGYEGLVEPVTYRTLDPFSTATILAQGGTILGSTNQGRFAALSSDNRRINLDPELLRAVQRTVRELNITALVCIGGDGSLAVAQQFHEVGIPVVGVPKTIDNDLSCTAFTFGFDSAVACATDALDRLRTTGASHQRTMVLEVMGRHAGWIALHAGIAGGADCILLPEIPWTYEHLCAKLLAQRAAGYTDSLIVVAEGASLPDGQSVLQERRSEDRQVRLGGVGNVIALEITARTQSETRCTVLGHLQRGGSPTPFDRCLATQLGAHAMRLVEERGFGRMVCYLPPEIADATIADAIETLNQVAPDCSAVQSARWLGISFGDAPPHVLPTSLAPPTADMHTPRLTPELPLPRTAAGFALPTRSPIVAGATALAGIPASVETRAPAAVAVADAVAAAQPWLIPDALDTLDAAEALLPFAL